MGDIAGWVDIGLEEHSYSWSALRPSLTQGINDTHVGTFGLTIFLETFDLTDTYHICFPQSGYLFKGIKDIVGHVVLDHTL